MSRYLPPTLTFPPPAQFKRPSAADISNIGNNITTVRSIVCGVEQVRQVSLLHVLLLGQCDPGREAEQELQLGPHRPDRVLHGQLRHCQQAAGADCEAPPVRVGQERREARAAPV